MKFLITVLIFSVTALVSPYTWASFSSEYEVLVPVDSKDFAALYSSRVTLLQEFLNQSGCAPAEVEPKEFNNFRIQLLSAEVVPNEANISSYLAYLIVRSDSCRIVRSTGSCEANERAVPIADDERKQKICARKSG